LPGILHFPPEPKGVVVFVGGGRFSPRSQFVAQILQKAGLATLLLDLLDGEKGGQNMADAVGRLSDRLLGAADWLRHEPETMTLRLGYFGAGVGAAAAIEAAAREPAAATTLASWDGRLDLACEHLAGVRAPILMIVDDADESHRIDQVMLDLLNCPKAVVVIPGATHLLPEPGALQEVALLAKEWFRLQFLNLAGTSRHEPQCLPERAPTG